MSDKNSNDEDRSAIDPYTFIKQNVDLLEALEKYHPHEQKSDGERIIIGPCFCPDCVSSDACKVYPEDGRYKCFSCNGSGSVIDAYVHTHGLDPEEDSYVACENLAKDFGLDLPKKGSSPIQQILNDAADFYHQQLLDDKTIYSELADKSPLQYQIEVRDHSLAVLKEHKVGWTKGRKELLSYLMSLGYDRTLIAEAGLLDGKKKGDLFNNPTFLYPFIYRKNTLRFKQKDPTGQRKYHMKKDFYRTAGNHHLFYNIQDLYKCRRVMVVEGENDVLSVLGSDWKTGKNGKDHGVIGTGGSISDEQVRFLKNYAMASKAPLEYITAFDTDPAGDGYRQKIGFMCQEMNQDEVKHIIVPLEEGETSNDIDMYIRKGGTVKEALKNHTQSIVESLSKEGIRAIPGSTIVEKSGGYYRRKDGKDNEVFYDQLTDFVIRMSHIMVHRMERVRKVRVIGVDETHDTEFTSSCKTSSQQFETRIANTVDGTFWGKEKDLKDIWKFIYATTPRRMVHISDYCGHVTENGLDLWLFRNCAIERGGNVVMCGEDDGGIFWIGGNSMGVKPASQRENTSSHTDAGIPFLRVQNSEADYREYTEFYLRMFDNNFGNRTLLTLILNGWAMASAYSETVFKELGEFPILCLWGKYGRGKTTVTGWLQSLYGMEDCGATTVSNLRSGVGMERKASYYSSLPISIDEIRNNKETKEHFAKFRGWYNRSARSMGSREDPTKVVDVDVRSTFMLTGEDLPEDPALRSRLIALKLPKDGGADEMAYHWLNSAAEANNLTSVGLHWIIQAMKQDYNAFCHERRQISNMLTSEHKCNARTANVWSVVYLMARKLKDEHKYFSGYDTFEEDMIDFIINDQGEQTETDSLTEYWETILIILAEERSPITHEHLSVKDGELFIWMHAVHTLVSEKYAREHKELLSEQAIRQMIKECPYFVSSGKYRIGHNLQKRGIKLDLETAPDEVKSFLAYIQSPAGLQDSDLANSSRDAVDENNGNWEV